MTYNQAICIRNEYQFLVTQPGGINLISEVVIAPQNNQQEFVNAVTDDNNFLTDLELIESFEDSSYAVLIISDFNGTYSFEDYKLYSYRKNDGQSRWD